KVPRTIHHRPALRAGPHRAVLSCDLARPQRAPFSDLRLLSPHIGTNPRSRRFPAPMRLRPGVSRAADPMRRSATARAGRRHFLLGSWPRRRRRDGKALVGADGPDLCAGRTVLKLAHYGSRTGTDAPWLELVRSRLAVASVGKGKEYGHPSPQTIALLSRRGIPLLRTDRDGAVTIENDGRKWRVVGHDIAARDRPGRSG